VRPASYRSCAIAAVGALALTGALAACGSSDSEPTQSEAESGVCDQVAEVMSAVGNVQALSADSTVDEAHMARDDLSAAVDDLKTSAQDLAEADAQALSDGVDSIRTAIADFAGVDSRADELDDIVVAADGLWSAIREIGDGYECTWPNAG